MSLLNLKQIFKDIIDPEESFRQSQRASSPGYTSGSKKMNGLVYMWKNTKGISGLPNDAENLMRRMAKEVAENFENYEILPDDIKNNSQYVGNYFYEKLDEQISISSLRYEVKKALKIPEEERGKSQQEAIKIYSDIHNIGPLESVQEYLDNYDELSVANKKIEEIAKKYGKDLIKNEEAMTEMALIVVKTPEAFNVVPTRVKNFTASSNPFYEVLSDNERKIKDLSYAIYNKQNDTSRISPEEMAAFEITEQIAAYQEDMQYQSMNSLEPRPISMEDIDQYSKDYNEMIKNSDYPEMTFGNEDIEYEDIYRNDYEMQDLFSDMYENFLGGIEQEIAQENETKNPQEENRDKIEQIKHEEPDKSDDIETLIDTRIDIDSKPHVRESDYLEEEFEVGEIDASEENFYSLIGDWEASKIGGQMRYMPDEIQGAIATIVANNQKYYTEVPLDMSNPEDPNNRTFFETLAEKLKDVKNVMKIISDNIAKFKENFGLGKPEQEIGLNKTDNIGR